MAKAKKMSAATKAMLAERKAAKKSGAKKKTSAKKSAKKSSSKSLARAEAAKLGHAHAGYKLAVAPKGASSSKRLATLEKNVAMVAHGLGVVADEVMMHRKALLGAGLLSARGAGKAR